MFDPRKRLFLNGQKPEARSFAQRLRYDPKSRPHPMEAMVPWALRDKEFWD